ncbi:MBL fold metallo-hydrolase [Kineococcus arenarius]|uniref:MBL fold metallo-hydrolase n=1 Tax=unclassified Kineococcus TaxID=2621656 RepID=UPI003D7DF464
MPTSLPPGSPARPVATDDDCCHAGCAAAGAPTSRRSLLAAAAVLAAAVPLAPRSARAVTRDAPARTAELSWYELVPGFVATRDDPDDSPPGTGFAEPNPWGSYTAYRVSTSALGHRTWRIENMAEVNARRSQGSTMWLFEGSRRALLIDTAQNTPDVLGESDLKIVVAHLLGHEDDGSPRPDPVDFDVANTHRHGDHTGKNAQMGDRTVYYPELDWPEEAPSNYVPVREGGGASTVGGGEAVGELDLGGRTIRAVAMYGHTPGSTGYLDVENRVLATGDAVGSAYVWAHFDSATTTLYRDVLGRLREVLAPLDGIALLPAHFYQVKQFARGLPPVDGRPLDAQYVTDMFDAASAALDGSVAAEPYRTIGREVVWIGVRSARMTFSLANLYPGGPRAGDVGDDSDAYHLVAIPGGYRSSPDADASYAFLDNIRTRLHMVRDSANQSLFLVSGSERALLVGTGRGTRGLADYVRGLVPGHPLEVLLTSDDTGQVGGLPQFAGHTVHLPAAAVVDTAGLAAVNLLHDGDLVPLGTDDAGRPVELEVYSLPGHSASSTTVLDPVSRVLFAGDALGEQGPGGGLTLHTPLEEFAAALAAWRRKTDGRYDTVHTAHNHQWHTSPEYVDNVQAAVADGIARGAAAHVASPRIGYAALRAGDDDTLALVLLPL